MKTAKTKIGRFARFAHNDVGRDFVVGDIHGCRSDLESAMAAVQFNKDVDRLFSVGDLVDRGPESLEMLRLAADSDWFHAVCGNHDALSADVGRNLLIRLHEESQLRLSGEEIMAIDSMDAQWIVDLVEGVQQGEHPLSDLQLLIEPATWPLAIEVETAEGPVGLLHADPCAAHWPEVVARLSRDQVDERDADALVWGRKGILKAWEFLKHQESPGVGPSEAEINCAGLARLYSGHTPVGKPMTAGNRTWIDSGAIFDIEPLEIHPIEPSSFEPLIKSEESPGAVITSVSP